MTTSVTLWVDALEPQPGGIGRYTWELCKGLAARDDLAVHYFGRGQMLDDPAVLLRGEPLPRPRQGLRRWWEQRQVKASLVHGPNYFLPPFAEQGIITVHDLSVFRFPETHPAERVAAFEREFLNSLGRATHIITDTETVKREIIADFSIAPDRVTAIPLGVDASFHPRPDDDLAPALAAWGLAPRRFGLCVSTLEPRKRISELLDAWRALPASLRQHYPLVLCGGAGWRNERLREQVEAGVAEGWLHYLGFVPEAQLPALYAGAALFVYPSIYEGFGLPPVEAMASGTPVIVSCHSCMPEVCGGAARYVDPDDPAAFVATLEEALSDATWRTDAARRGLDHATGFDWRHCVERTAALYHRLG